MEGTGRPHKGIVHRMSSVMFTFRIVPGSGGIFAIVTGISFSPRAGMSIAVITGIISVVVTVIKSPPGSGPIQGRSLRLSLCDR